jgi:chorismate synthase
VNMAGSIYGTVFRLSTFGESHGKSIGGIIDGCPSGFIIDFDKIQNELDRRRPGQSKISTDRNEEDIFEIQSGIFEGKTTGTPIAFIIKNKDARSKDYGNIKSTFRPSHADYTYQEKYGIRDYRGGGRSSARETAVRVVAGAIARQFLEEKGIRIYSWVHRVGDIAINVSDDSLDLSKIESNIVRCPDAQTAELMIAKITEFKDLGDSLGGAIKCMVKGMPVGLGEPVFDKLNAELAKAIFSINAVKYMEIGAGKAGTFKSGSQLNDEFISDGEKVSTSTNNSGGILGGISNGEDLIFETGFKPVATIMKDQNTINMGKEAVVIKAEGRHDPCVLPRAVPIIEAMTAMLLIDMFLRDKTTKWI